MVSSQYRARLRAPADFGLALQQGRMSRGLSQTEVAELLGVTQSTISSLESGKATIHLRQILEFVKLIGIELYAEWDDNAPQR